MDTAILHYARRNDKQVVDISKGRNDIGNKVNPGTVLMQTLRLQRALHATALEGRETQARALSHRAG